MKSSILAFLGTLVIGVSAVYADINGVEDDILFGVTTSCTIEDAFGSTVTTIDAINQTGELPSWLFYNSGGTTSMVDLFIIPLFPSPVAFQWQRFDLTTSPITSIKTPFGIPFWFDAMTSGRYVAITQNSGGEVSFCLFDVVP